MPSKHLAFILALLAIGLLLLLTWDGAPVQANANNLALSHSLCFDTACNPGQDGTIRLYVAPGEVWQQPDRLNPCQRLWLSRIQAPASPDLALSTLDTAESCPRKYLLWNWAGTLAWNQGMRNKAGEQWTQLPSNDLIANSYAMMLAGDVARGRYILDLVLRDREQELSPLLRKQLYARLGDSYRLEAKWSQAAAYYDKAWQLDLNDSENRFYLGLSLRESGQPEKAIAVLEGGLSGLPTDREYFVSDNYLQLGLAYQNLGRTAEALELFRSAKDWLSRYENPSQGQLDFIQQLIDHLE